MKYKMMIMLIFFVCIAGAEDFSSKKDFDYSSYGQMIYWKTLTLEEKKVFLYAYLYRTNEILEQMKKSYKFQAVMNDFKKEITEPVFNIYDDLDKVKKEKLIGWIDIFYKSKFNHDKPFFHAIVYAFRKISKEKSPLEKALE